MIDVLAALDQPARPLGDDLRDGDVVLRREVGRRGDDLAAHAAAEVGDFFGTLVDQEHDDVDVRVVDGDGVRHPLQERRLARPWAARRSGSAGRGRSGPAGPTTRPHISSGSVSSFRWSCGSIETSSWNAGRWRKAAGLQALDRLDAAKHRPVPVDGEARDQRARLRGPRGRSRRAGRADRWESAGSCSWPKRGRRGRFPSGRQEEDAFDGPLGTGGGDLVDALVRVAARPPFGPGGLPPPAAAAASAAPAPPAPRCGRGAPSPELGALGLNGNGRRKLGNQGVFGHELPNSRRADSRGPGGKPTVPTSES